MNNTRKRSSMMVRLVAALAVTMMFTMCLVGGTFAKYTSSATGNDNANVAKWDIRVNGANITTSDTFTFDLFNTVNDTKDNNAETDMAPNGGTIIAPGTRGYFDIVIKNDSQVNATYAIDYTVNTRSIPVKFSVNGTDWFDDINYLDVRGVAINMGATATVTVQWMWEFERIDGDTQDTTLGSAASAATLTVAAEVTATQVD